MYITSSQTYYSGSEQHSTKAYFLILAQPEDERPTYNNIRCFVRKVALHQCGHFMMGRANIGGKYITISGQYGNDGLPKTLDRKTWEKGIPLPDELYTAWNENKDFLIHNWATTLIKKGK